MEIWPWQGGGGWVITKGRVSAVNATVLQYFQFEYWDTGILETSRKYWNIGLFETWKNSNIRSRGNIGTLEYWNPGNFQTFIIGIFEHWNIGSLPNSNIPIFLEEILGNLKEEILEHWNTNLGKFQ